MELDVQGLSIAAHDFWREHLAVVRKVGDEGASQSLKIPRSKTGVRAGLLYSTLVDRPPHQLGRPLSSQFQPQLDE